MASHHADTMQEGGPEKHQQLKQQPKPRLQLKLYPKPQQQPKPKSSPTTPRLWETVLLRAQSQRAPIGPGPTPTAGSCMAERRLMPWRDEGVPLPKQMDQEIASATNRAVFHQKAPAHIRVMNAKSNALGTMTAITHANSTGAREQRSGDVIITAVPTVDQRVIDVEKNESWERLKVHAIPLVRYMGNATEGLQKMRYEIHTGNEEVTVPVQVRWLESLPIIDERSQMREISASSVLFVIMGTNVARRLVRKGMKAAGVWYRVELLMTAASPSRCEHCCGRRHIQSKCIGKPTCGSSSGPHHSSDHKCNVVRWAAKGGALCSRTQEKCPDCSGNHIAFSSWCGKKADDTRAASEVR